MSLEYRVYSNDNRGGPVILGAPPATTSSLTWTSPNLPAPSDTTFLVRTFDTASGLEDPNTDARVRIILDQEGNDISGYPRAPIGLTVRPLAGGAARVTWTGQAFAGATGFSVYVWEASGAPDYAAEVVSVAASPDNPARRYSATITGLAGGTAYRVGVRAFNGAGEERNTITVGVTGRTAGPAAIVPVSAAAAP